jgi:Zn-dependent protease with chaperone function
MNAYALPSKDVFVYTGLLNVLPDDNAMLAAVIAHEIAHVVERHSVENLGVSPCYLLLGATADDSFSMSLLSLSMSSVGYLSPLQSHFPSLPILPESVSTGSTTSWPHERTRVNWRKRQMLLD